MHAKYNIILNNSNNNNKNMILISYLHFNITHTCSQLSGVLKALDEQMLQYRGGHTCSMAFNQAMMLKVMEAGIVCRQVPRASAWPVQR